MGIRESDRARMRELIDILNRASEAYYNENTEIMSNLEYDGLYDELAALEEKTGITMSDSPTEHVGYAAAAELPKERHEAPMLSLDKTKDREALRGFLGSHDGLLSWKMDGLTVVLTYEGGRLSKAVTRGNGEIGEVITDNARVFENVPLRIPFQGTLILRGEAVIRYSDFQKINEQLEEEAIKTGDPSFVQYKNPRNLCSGSVRQLNNKITAERHVRFYAFALVQADGMSFDNSVENQFRFLSEQGFDVVEYERVNADTVVDAVGEFEKKAAHSDLPSDGLVLVLDDIAYGLSLGMTAKFPRNAIAFKWEDELAQTTLLGIEWSASRTGRINPVAVFDPVELEGTTVKRASVHNLSMINSLQLGIGDQITVYKANMIIPQIAENLTRSGGIKAPEQCPVCGAPTRVLKDNESEFLYCPNEECPAKKVQSFVHFVQRGAMNIDGLSEMTLEKLIDEGLIKNYADIYHLKDHKDAIEKMDGFGARSCEKLLSAIETSRDTTPERVLFAIGIPGIGEAGARAVCQYFDGDMDRIRRADLETLAQIEGVGGKLAANIKQYWDDPQTAAQFDRLMEELHLETAKGAEMPQTLAGKTVVITGNLKHFENRGQLQELIRQMGGKAAGSVSAKTDYLINNDASSSSNKNKKARELGVPILTEDDFLEMIHYNSVSK